MKKPIAILVDRLRGRLIRTRRDFYLHPELAGKEERTAGVVAERLRALGLEVRTGVGGHGVIGVLRGKQAGPVVAWRADMDALPIQDILEAPCRSCVPGVKHACGHDAHTTIGLGAAEVLASLRDDIAGTVKFLFQPAEETAQGARAVIADGGLDDPRPTAIFGLHVSPAPAGRVLFAPVVCLGAITLFSVALRRRAGGDAVNLEQLSSALLAALEQRNALRYPSSPEELDALMQAMAEGSSALDDFTFFGFMRQEAGPTPDVRFAHGSLFTATDELRHTGLNLIRETLAELAPSQTVAYELTHEVFTPATINDEALMRETEGAIAAALGVENIARNKAAWPFGGEDFAYYLREIPGAFFFLGAADRAQGIVALPHTPDFDVADEALVAGVKAAASVLLNFLDRRAQV